MSNEFVHLAFAPSIPGVVFRPMQGEEDLPAMLAVINGSKAADSIDEVETLENLRNTYANLAHCDPDKDVLLAQVDGRVVGYSRVMWHDLVAGGRVYVNFGYLLPECRNRGIGRAMLRHNQRRNCDIAATHSANGPRWHESFAYEGEAGKCGLLEAEGYEIARRFYLMVRPNLDDIPDARLPEGLEVRPARPEHLRTIWDAANEAFSDAWGEEVQDENSFERFTGSVEFAPDIWKVAWDVATGEVAGVVLGYIKEAENRAHNRKLGWTENIAVRKPWRKRGLAAALMAENMRELKARGMTEAALGVDTENVTGALRLYERMGFRPVKTEFMYRKPM